MVDVVITTAPPNPAMNSTVLFDWLVPFICFKFKFPQLERQKKLHDEQMQLANSQYEEQKRQDALRQQQERDRIEAERIEMEN